MIDTPEIVLSENRRIAVVPVKVARDEMQDAFGAAMGELKQTLGRQDVAPAGPVLARYLEITPETFELEVGVPVEEAVEAEGRVKESSIPETKVARTIHHGGYDGLSAAWATLEAWMEDRDLPRGSGVWEVYRVGPDTTDDPSEWKTELCWPIGEGGR